MTNFGQEIPKPVDLLPYAEVDILFAVEHGSTKKAVEQIRSEIAQVPWLRFGEKLGMIWRSAVYMNATNFQAG